MSSNSDLFQDVDETQYYNRPDKPIWALGIEDRANDGDIHKWLEAELAFLKEENRERFTRIMRNHALFRGIMYQQQETREERVTSQSATIERIVVNQHFDLVKQKTSRMIKYRPGINIQPTNNEWQDQIAAENVDAWLHYVWYQQKFDGVLQPELIQSSKIDGEAYLFIEWDPDAGDYVDEFTEEMQKQLKTEGKVPLVGQDGKPVLDSNGKPVVLTGPVYQGDVVYRLVPTTDVLVHRVRQWGQAEYIFRRELMEVEKARLMWPEAAHNIVPDEGALIYEYDKMQVRKTKRNECVIWRFYHKRTLGCEQGREIVFTHKGILESKPFRYSHRNLPCVPLIDTKMPNELHGHSFLQMTAPITGAYNNITNAILKNQMLVAYPKWMVPAGSVKIESLGNDITIVQFKGPTPPQLAQMNPTAPELFSFREVMKQEAKELAGGASGVQVGEPPPGIKSGVALELLDERERDRQNEDVLRYADWIKEVAKMTISVGADMYPKDEKRMVRMVGKDAAWKVTSFDPSHLSKPYDIKVDNGSAMSQSAATRKQNIIDLNEAFPGMLSQERVLDMLDLGADKQYVNTATVSTRAAEAENEALLNVSSPLPVGEPQAFEDHLKHWDVHVRRIRAWDYKHRVPKENRKLIEDHILTHEFMMWDRMKLDPTYQEKLAALEGWPCFFKIPVPPPEPVPPPVPGGSTPEGQDAAMMQQGGPMAGPAAPEPQEPVAPEMPPLAEQASPIEAGADQVDPNAPQP